MERPPSIVWFERSYLGATAVSLVNVALSWQATLNRLSENPAAAQLGESFGRTVLMLGTAIAVVIPLTLWFFTARKRSTVAKWVIVAFFALGVLSIAGEPKRGTLQSGLTGVLMIVAFVLNGVAVWQLFRPDARAWFGQMMA